MSGSGEGEEGSGKEDEENIGSGEKDFDTKIKATIRPTTKGTLLETFQL